MTNDVVYQDLVENIALDQARAGNLQRATAILDLLDSGWRKEAAAAEMWILCGQWDKAAAAIDAITRDYNRIVERAHLAAAIRPLDPARSDALFTQAEQDAAVLQDDWMVDELRQEALGEIVSAHLSCSNTGAAWETVATMAPSRVKVQAALRYVEAIWESQQNEAVRILQALLELPGQAGNDETELLEDLSRTLIRCGLASDAVHCIERLSAIDRSAEHRAAISRLYASMGDFEQASARSWQSPSISMPGRLRNGRRITKRSSLDCRAGFSPRSPAWPPGSATTGGRFTISSARPWLIGQLSKDKFMLLTTSENKNG